MCQRKVDSGLAETGLSLRPTYPKALLAGDAFGMLCLSFHEGELRGVSRIYGKQKNSAA